MRLRPDARDRLLTILDLLTSGAATLSTTVILQGQVTRVSDALFAAVGSADPLPALAGDQVQNLLMLTDAPRSYGDLAKALLLGMPRVLQARAEHDEMQAQARQEADAENRKLTAQAKAEAEGLPPPHLGRPRKTSDARKNSGVDRSAAKARRAA